MITDSFHEVEFRWSCSMRARIGSVIFVYGVETVHHHIATKLHLSQHRK
jgi:hypothetical protein